MIWFLQVGFCSNECRKEGMAGCHWQECPVLPIFQVLNLKDHRILAYKLMMKVGYAALKELGPQLQSEAINQPPETLGFNSEGVYDGSTYRSLFHLVTNKKKRSKDDILKRCLQAFVVTKLLEKSKRFFITSDGVPFTPTQEDFVRTGSTIIHHMMSFTCNSRAIQQFLVQYILSEHYFLNFIGSPYWSVHLEVRKLSKRDRSRQIIETIMKTEII